MVSLVNFYFSLKLDVSLITIKHEYKLARKSMVYFGILDLALRYLFLKSKSSGALDDLYILDLRIMKLAPSYGTSKNHVSI